AWRAAEGNDEDAEGAVARLREACLTFANKHGARPLTQILGLEFALHRREAQQIAEVLSHWPGAETGPAKALASALVLEVAGDKDAAREQYKRALELDPQHEGATRALLEDAPPAQAAELLARLADTSDDPTQAGFLLLEAALL